jgi:hypothetical protein
MEIGTRVAVDDAKYRQRGQASTSYRIGNDWREGDLVKVDDSDALALGMHKPNAESVPRLGKWSL